MTLISSISYTKNTETPAQKTYTAKKTDADDSFSQELSVNWISEGTIEYTLTINNESCSSTYRGKATSANIKDKKTGEIKAVQAVIKNKRKSFLATHYTEKNRDFKVSIQIDSENKNIAVVKFSTFLKDEYQIQCRSREVLMLARN